MKLANTYGYGYGCPSDSEGLFGGQFKSKWQEQICTTPELDTEPLKRVLNGTQSPKKENNGQPSNGNDLLSLYAQNNQFRRVVQQQDAFNSNQSTYVQSYVHPNPDQLPVNFIEQPQPVYDPLLNNIYGFDYNSTPQQQQSESQWVVQPLSPVALTPTNELNSEYVVVQPQTYYQVPVSYNSQDHQYVVNPVEYVDRVFSDQYQLQQQQYHPNPGQLPVNVMEQPQLVYDPQINNIYCYDYKSNPQQCYQQLQCVVQPLPVEYSSTNELNSEQIVVNPQTYYQAPVNYNSQNSQDLQYVVNPVEYIDRAFPVEQQLQQQHQ